MEGGYGGPLRGPGWDQVRLCQAARTPPLGRGGGGPARPCHMEIFPRNSRNLTYDKGSQSGPIGGVHGTKGKHTSGLGTTKEPARNPGGLLTPRIELWVPKHVALHESCFFGREFFLQSLFCL